MIDLDDYIFGSQIRFYQGIPVAVSGDVVSRVYRSPLGRTPSGSSSWGFAVRQQGGGGGDFAVPVWGNRGPPGQRDSEVEGQRGREG
jgi:hypothetical protein